MKAKVNDEESDLKVMLTAKEQLMAGKKLAENLEDLAEVKKLFDKLAQEYVDDVRAFRMTTVADLTTSLIAFKDLRQFFLSEKHEEEMRRLKEFVELCERLKALKDSGFLDVVADTMLKL